MALNDLVQRNLDQGQRSTDFIGYGYVTQWRNDSLYLRAVFSDEKKEEGKPSSFNTA